MTAVAIVKARMDTTRLSNKMILSVKGVPIAGWVLQRVRQARLVDKIVFAIPDTPADDILADYLEDQAISVFCSSEYVRLCVVKCPFCSLCQTINNLLGANLNCKL